MKLELCSPTERYHQSHFTILNPPVSLLNHHFPMVSIVSRGHHQYLIRQFVCQVTGHRFWACGNGCARASHPSRPAAPRLTFGFPRWCESEIPAGKLT